MNASGPDTYASVREETASDFEAHYDRRRRRLDFDRGLARSTGVGAARLAAKAMARKASRDKEPI